MIAMFAALLLAACISGRDATGTEERAAEGPQQQGAPSLMGATRARVAFPDGRTFLVEVADTSREHARGLMYRERLDPGLGMIFVYETPGIHSFWMKNTLISLDMIWLDPQGQVVHLERSVPPCRQDPCPSYTPLRPAASALEVAAGQAEGLRLGDRLLVAPEADPPGI